RLPACPREYIARLSSEDGGALLDVKTLEDASEKVALVDHSKYKYLISLDGQTCSSRFEKLLGLNSAVLKQDSPYYGFYYRALRAYEQYLPFWVNGQKDILGVIQWATENDEVVERIAAAGRKFASAHLRRHGRLCYWKELLTAYSKLMRYEASLEAYPNAVKLSEEPQMHSVKPRQGYT
ncbi:hypothetical protein CYMTET_12058, partial [Cymbomonas tetramitiformis]